MRSIAFAAGIILALSGCCDRQIVKVPQKCDVTIPPKPQKPNFKDEANFVEYQGALLKWGDELENTLNKCR